MTDAAFVAILCIGMAAAFFFVCACRLSGQMSRSEEKNLDKRHHK